MSTQQIDLPVIAEQLPKRELTPLALMMAGLESGKLTAADLQVLQEMHFRQQAKDAEIEFNIAMNAIQSEIGRIAPDLNNPQTSSKYASYKALDKVIRPVYTKYGLSLSFSEEDCQKADHVRIICYVSKGLHTRVYRKDMPVDNKGIKGNAMMTPTHATASADSYGKRYLLKDIFNVAIGEDDTDGNGAPTLDNLNERLEWIANCRNIVELEARFKADYLEARKLKDERAMKALIAAKDARKKELQ